jgi:transposase
MTQNLAVVNPVRSFLWNGRCELDNNLIENKIKPLALGRVIYLFAGSLEAAQRLAIMYSFSGSCAANDVNPMKWLTNVLDNINDTRLPNRHQLLPHNYKL